MGNELQVPMILFASELAKGGGMRDKGVGRTVQGPEHACQDALDCAGEAAEFRRVDGGEIMAVFHRDNPTFLVVFTTPGRR